MSDVFAVMVINRCIWNDNENNAFVSSKEDMFVTIKDRSMQFKVTHYANCGRRFENTK